MAIKIKNWKDFQHYKDRRPPWIKLHRSLIDDVDFHELSGNDFKYLVMLWIIASEDPKREGYLPASKKLAFRLRVSEKKIKELLSSLKDWIINDDSGVLASGEQDATPETETEEETEEEAEEEPINPGTWEFAGKMCEMFISNLKKRNPSNTSTVTKTWHEDMDKIMRIDGRTEAQLEYVIGWVDRSTFWSGNIMSPSKLRKQFNQLEAQIIAENEKLKKAKLSPSVPVPTNNLADEELHGR